MSPLPSPPSLHPPALSAGLVNFGPAPAPGAPAPTTSAHPAEAPTYPTISSPASATSTAKAALGDVTYLVADLIGANEVRTVPTTPAGDPDGHAVEYVRIEGNEVRYAIAWADIAPPNHAHIHR